MIGPVVRSWRYLPILLLFGATIWAGSIYRQTQVQADEISRLRSAFTLSQEAVRRHAMTEAALAREITRQAEQAQHYRAARESLKGKQDGPVAPVLRGVLEALR